MSVERLYVGYVVILSKNFSFLSLGLGGLLLCLIRGLICLLLPKLSGYGLECSSRFGCSQVLPPVALGSCRSGLLLVFLIFLSSPLAIFQSLQSFGF